MGNQLTNNAEALRLFFTEDIYLVAKDNEIAETAEPLIIPQKSKTEFKYLGKNQKKVLILVNDEKNDVSTELGRELLRKLVKAIDLTANDFALVNYAAYTSETFEDLSSFFNCKLMIAFGVTAIDLGLPAQSLHQFIDYNEAKLLFTKNLHDLDADQISKKVLWASLQQLKL